MGSRCSFVHRTSGREYLLTLCSRSSRSGGGVVWGSAALKRSGATSVGALPATSIVTWLDSSCSQVVRSPIFEAGLPRHADLPSV